LPAFTGWKVRIVGARELLLVRHGESTANVAASAAEAVGAEQREVLVRDADIPLTEVGVAQALAIGHWLRTIPDDAFPDAVWSSPYRRAVETAELATASQRIALPVRPDERLRDRELGILDTLTAAGVETRLPVEAARRRRLGRFYYRAPGGESWADVALRARTLLADLDRPENDGRVLLVSHDVVILVTRYICEGLSEAEILEISRSAPLRNASISRLLRPAGTGPWTVDTWNSVRHLEPHP
jgi:broad specificity phosphatase PhoE